MLVAMNYINSQKKIFLFRFGDEKHCCCTEQQLIFGDLVVVPLAKDINFHEYVNPQNIVS